MLGIEVRALGAGEELVPRAVQRPLPLDDQRVRPCGGDPVAQRTFGEDAAQIRGQRRGDAGARRETGGAQALERGAHHRAVGRRSRALVDLGEHAGQHLGALGAHQVRVDAGGDLHLGGVGPGLVRGGVRLEAEAPVPGGLGADGGLPEVEARIHRVQRLPLLPAVGRGQHQLHAHRIVPLTEGVGGDGDRLALDAAGGEPAAVDHRLHVHDRDPADPGSQSREVCGLGHGPSCLGSRCGRDALR